MTEPFDILAARAAEADARLAWPAASWSALAATGGLGWCVPRAFGGEGLSGPDLLERYERLAGACLTTCFLLSQRDAACRRLAAADNEKAQEALLPALARGERFATVGLSQLTTSRQHTRPALVARTDGDRLVFDGVMPWVTGAERADHFVTGAVLDDGRQVLAVVPRETNGVTVGPSLELAALRGSLTAEVRCDGAAVGREGLLAGPAEKAVTGSGGLETSCLALGLAGAAAGYLHREAGSRPDLRDVAHRLERERQATRDEMYRLAAGGASPEEAARLRAAATGLALRSTQAALTAAKGAGFLSDHPAQRWARQALFFLVWSCPRPAAEALFDFLAPTP